MKSEENGSGWLRASAAEILRASSFGCPQLTISFSVGSERSGGFAAREEFAELIDGSWRHAHQFGVRADVLHV